MVLVFFLFFFCFCLHAEESSERSRAVFFFGPPTLKTRFFSVPTFFFFRVFLRAIFGPARSGFFRGSIEVLFPRILQTLVFLLSVHHRLLAFFFSGSFFFLFAFCFRELSEPHPFLESSTLPCFSSASLFSKKLTFLCPASAAPFSFSGLSFFSFSALVISLSPSLCCCPSLPFSGKFPRPVHATERVTAPKPVG